MKRLILISLLLIPFGPALADSGGQVLFPLSGQNTNAAPKTFTGTAFVRTAYKTAEPMKAGGTFVFFAPGARTYWHEHPGGQSFVVLDGEGYVQEEGKPKVLLKAGDAVVCPPGVKHWHGASENKSMLHFAVSERGPDGKTAIWHGPVSDADYAGR